MTVAMERPIMREKPFAWPAVLACFASAMIAWGFGFYGQSVFLASLQASQGWSTALIASATTAYYLCGAVLMTLTPDWIARWGSRVVILGGAVALAGGTLALTCATAPWQLFAANLVMAVGWATTSGTAITTTLAQWFDAKRGLAISLALNGSSIAGFGIAPALVYLSQAVSLTAAVALVAAGVLALLVPTVMLGLRGAPRAAASSRAVGAITRREVLRSHAFRTVAAFYALALIAQVGFMMHEVAFLTPRLGATGAADALAATSFAAMLGRLALGMVIDRLDQRRVAAISVTSQAVGLAAILLFPDLPVALYGGVILFGLSVGNLITLPALIVQREFPAAAFGVVIGLATAISQFAFAFAPALLGIVHDVAGGYPPALVLCIAVQLAAASVVLRGRAAPTQR